MEVPSQWSLMDMKACCWEGLKASKGDADETRQSRLKALKRASAKKSDLVKFLSTEGIPVAPNQTIAKMYAVGLQSITEDYEPTSTELVNFGKYAEMTYQAIVDEHPSYIDWCRKRTTVPTGG